MSLPNPVSDLAAFIMNGPIPRREMVEKSAPNAIGTAMVSVLPPLCLRLLFVYGGEYRGPEVVLSLAHLHECFVWISCVHEYLLLKDVRHLRRDDPHVGSPRLAVSHHVLQETYHFFSSTPGTPYAMTCWVAVRARTPLSTLSPSPLISSEDTLRFFTVPSLSTMPISRMCSTASSSCTLSARMA